MTNLTGNTVKKYLREQGIDTKNISVNINLKSYIPCIRVVLKDFSLNLNEIDKILKDKYIEYELDENGEILFCTKLEVKCKYDFDTVEHGIKDRMKKAGEFMEEAKNSEPGQGVTIYENDNFKAVFFYDGNDFNSDGYVSVLPKNINAIKPKDAKLYYGVSLLKHLAKALLFIEKEDVIFTEFLA